MIYINTYKSIFLIYTILFAFLIFPFWSSKNVITAHRQAKELAINDGLKNGPKENRSFNDYNLATLPECSEILNGQRSDWLALWTEKTELGRPIFQISGISPAYFISWALSQVTHDPFRFLTLLSLLTCYLAGIFMILFSKEIALTPMAGLIAGISFSTSPVFMFRISFPIIISVWCWSASALWSVTRIGNRSDFIGWITLVFSSYSLLMTGYPQFIVYHVYILVSYGLYLSYRKAQISFNQLFKFLALSISALIFGALLASPVYLDLLTTFKESARVNPDLDFFAMNFPKFNSILDVTSSLIHRTIPEIFGNPVEESYPLASELNNGFSFTILTIFFAIVGLLTKFRQNWGWWIIIGAICLLSVVHSLYFFGVKYLGFNLSRLKPQFSILLPITVVVAYGVDALFDRRNSTKVATAITVALIVCIFGIIAGGVAYGVHSALPIRWSIVFLMLLLVTLLAAQYDRARPLLLIISLIIPLASISYPLILFQNLSQIHKTSPLVEAVRDNLPEKSRFAISTPGMYPLLPNINVVVGLSSIHSYNSLSSKRYHTLIKSLGGEMLTYGRWNSSISPDYSSPMFWMSNISLMLSPTKLKHENLEYLGEVSGVHLSKVISSMGSSLQVPLPSNYISGSPLQLTDPRLLSTHKPIRLLDKTDFLEFEVNREGPSVLVLSQKFHRDWKAEILSNGNWRPTSTTEVNGVFQGVLLPPEVERVKLKFRPFVHYAWIINTFWSLIMVFIGFRIFQKFRYLRIKSI